jgi:DNA-binding transcriptional MerR regulator
MVAEPEKDSYRAAEVCRAADVAPYVLKYWQSEFPFLGSGKDQGPNRVYTRREVKIISRIRHLLYDEGFTIAGAKKKVEAEIAAGSFDEGKGPSAPAATATPAAAAPAKEKPRAEKPGLDRKSVAKDLREILKLLEKPLK